MQLLGRARYDKSDDNAPAGGPDALRESKLDEETELWLRRLRDEAYVEIRDP